MPQRTVFLFFFLFSLQGLADTHCVCEIGQNQNEKAFYRLGCETWISAKKCNSRKIIDRRLGYNLSSYIPNLKKGDTLELGFVGHWQNSQQTTEYISDQVVELVQKKQIDVNYDNTACSPMNDPEEIQEFLMDLNLPVQNHILVKGSQGISIGMWDVLFIGRANFYAYASSNWTTPKFLPCENIEEKNCSAIYQKGERGRCFDRGQKKLIWLTCRKNNDRPNHAWYR
jgi:hypothetical protein